MTTAATTLVAAGQQLTIKGRREDVAATVRAAAAKGELRDFQTTDGDWITVAAAGVALVTEAKTARKRRVGFIREED
jgi:hypothetical protein